MIAHKGETVTCENGHEICDVAEDISRYSYAEIGLFTAWRMGVPSDAVQSMSCRLWNLRSRIHPLDVDGSATAVSNRFAVFAALADAGRIRLHGARSPDSHRKRVAALVALRVGCSLFC